MPKKATYAQLLGTRQQELLITSVVEALREGTTLATSLQQFITGVSKTPAVKQVAGDITLGQIFAALRDVDEPIAAGPGRRAAKAGRKANGRRKTKTKTQTKAKTGRKTKTKTKGRRKTKTKVKAVRKTKTKARAKTKARGKTKAGGKRQRADSGTVAKRLDAIHKVLVDNGGWMKTGAIHEQLGKQKLFVGVVSNTLSQYLAKFATEKPKRVKKKGQRAASLYCVV